MEHLTVLVVDDEEDGGEEHQPAEAHPHDVRPLHVPGEHAVELAGEDAAEEVAEGDGHEVVAQVEGLLVRRGDAADVLLAGGAGHHFAEGEDEQ